MSLLIDVLLLFFYIYGFLLTISFFVFWTSDQIRTKVAPEQKPITEGGVILEWKGEEKKTISNLLTIGFYLSLLLGLLVLLYLIFRVFGNITIVLFGLIGLLITWNILEDFRLLSRFEFLSSRKWLYFIVKAVVTIPIGLIWAIAPSWLTYNLFGVLLGSFLIAKFMPKRLSRLMIFMVAIVIFDIVGVFVTGLIPKVALEFEFIPPMVILIPLNPLRLNMDFIGLLGLGDIFFSGLVVGFGIQYKIGKWLAVAYAIGLLVAILIPLPAVPAMMVLAPVLLLALLIVGRMKKVQFEW